MENVSYSIVVRLLLLFSSCSLLDVKKYRVTARFAVRRVQYHQKAATTGIRRQFCANKDRGFWLLSLRVGLGTESFLEAVVGECQSLRLDVSIVIITAIS